MGCGATSQAQNTTPSDEPASKKNGNTNASIAEIATTQDTQTKVLTDGADAIAAPSAEELVPRLLTPEERDEAWRNANFYNASSNRSRPIALWILGPSSVGKSTLTAQVGPKFEIPHLDERASGTAEGRTKLDAVLIDGEFIRDAHGVWQKWTKTSDWRSAYPALKSTINKEKDHLYTEATSQRKNLIIPQTLLNLQKGLDEVEGLMWQGYTNHIVAVVAPLEDCKRRGTSRELTTGKRYKPTEYEQSILAIPPMITSSNGKYEIVQAIERQDTERQDLKMAMDYQMLKTGPCCRHEEFINAPSSPFTEEELHKIIDDAIKINEMPRLSSKSKLSFDGLVNLTKGAARWRRSFSSPGPSMVTHTPVPTPIMPSAISLRPRPFQDEERKMAWTEANFYSASTNHEQPVVLWILGPSSVGKKELTEQLATRFPIASKMVATSDTQKMLDAVVVDGECFRKAYGVWNLWIDSPDKQFAYRALKSTIDKEKAAMVEEAILKRQHLVIPASLLNLEKGRTEVEELARSGYINHVIGVVASLDWCMQRGQDAEIQKGKGYRPEDFQESIDSILPMIYACNGRYEIVRPDKAAPTLGMDLQCELTFTCVTEGVGCRQASEGHPPDLKKVQEIINRTIAPTSRTGQI